MEPQYDSRSDLVWITKNDLMPDTCCDCGLFTHNRVTVKHLDYVTQEGTTQDGCMPVVLAIVIHGFLGPVGWLLSALLEGEKNGEPKIVKQKSKIKISQCQLCNGTKPPEIIESQIERFSFLVHPRFKDRFDELRGQSNEASR